MKTGRPKKVLSIDESQRATLQRWTRRAKTSQSLALRARIVLACAEGIPNTEVATAICVAVQPKRFVHRPGGRRKSFGFTATESLKLLRRSESVYPSSKRGLR